MRSKGLVFVAICAAFCVAIGLLVIYGSGNPAPMVFDLDHQWSPRLFSDDFPSATELSSKLANSTVIFLGNNTIHQNEVDYFDADHKLIHWYGQATKFLYGSWAIRP